MAHVKNNKSFYETSHIGNNNAINKFWKLTPYKELGKNIYNMSYIIYVKRKISHLI